MAIVLYGGARIEFSGLTIRRINGDGLYANENAPTAGTATAWPTDICRSTTTRSTPSGATPSPSTRAAG